MRSEYEPESVPETPRSGCGECTGCLGGVPPCQFPVYLEEDDDH